MTFLSSFDEKSIVKKQKSSLFPKIIPLTKVALLVFSTCVFADGNGGASAGVYPNENGSKGGAGGGGGILSQGGAASSSTLAGSSGNNAGNGGQGAAGANPTDKTGGTAGGAGGAVGSNGKGGSGKNGASYICKEDCVEQGAGGGGGGGDGFHGQDLADMPNDIVGGNGGNGGSLTNQDGISADGGSGGGGGAGAYLSGGESATTQANITGGNGGRGGTGTSGGAGGYGGAGGSGLISDSVDIINQHTIQGGNGGSGNGRLGGKGGDGVKGNDLKLINNGEIKGGDGAGEDPGYYSSGGNGISGENLNIINHGLIKGGTSSISSGTGNAIRFTSGSNRLELHHGSRIEGNVVGTGQDTLVLAGDEDSDFDFGKETNSKFTGFSEYQKIGSSTWSLTEVANQAANWSVKEGTLRLKVANAIANAKQVVVDEAATLSLEDKEQKLNNLSGAGTVEGSATLTVNNTKDTIFSGDLTLTEGAGLIKEGDASLQLDKATDYTGDSEIKAGTLKLKAANAIANSKNVSVSAAGTLDLGDEEQTINNLTGEGKLTGNGELTLNNNQDTTFSGIIDQISKLIKSGTSSLTLANQSDYHGETLVEKGELRLNAANAIANSKKVTVNEDATLNLGDKQQTINNLTGAGNLTGSATLTTHNTEDTSFAGELKLTDGAGLTKTGDGNLQLDMASDYTGVTDIQQGTLTLKAENSIASSSSVKVSQDATLDLGSDQQRLNNLSGNGKVTGQSTLTVNNSADSRFDGQLSLSDDADLIKTGSGTLELAQQADYKGETRVTEGELRLGVEDTLANSSKVTVDENATLNLGEDDQTINNLTGAGNLTGSATLTAHNTEDTSFAGELKLTDGAGLTKTGDGNLQLNRAADYSGVTDVQQGTLTLNSENAIANSSSVKVSQDATLDLGTDQQQLNNLSGNGKVTGQSNLTVNNSVDSRFDGELSLSDDADLIKTGSGTLELTQQADYNGETRVEEGELRLSVENAIANSNKVTVEEGAKLNFGDFNQLINQLTGGGDLVGNGELTINGSQDFTGSIAGINKLIKASNDLLTLYKKVTYQGETVIQAGTLKLTVEDTIASSDKVTIDSDAKLEFDTERQTLNNLNGSGQIVGNSALVLNNSEETIYSGSIKASELNKRGNQQLTLSGNDHDLSGDVNVEEGTLVWSNTNNVQLNGDYVTQSNATTVLNRGSHLDIKGALTQQADSTLRVSVGDGSGIKAKSADLTGSTLDFSGFTDLYGPDNMPTRASDMEGKTYTVLETENGIQGFEKVNVQRPDFMLFQRSLGNGDRDLILGTRLAWTAGSSQESTGTFTLDENSAFDVDVALNDQDNLGIKFTGTGWDGKSLTKNGAGRLRLSASNGYTGGTTLNDGIIQVSRDENLGAASGKLTFNGGTLQVDEGFASEREIEVTEQGGELDVVQGDLLLQGKLSGNGKLEKSGEGTLTLSASADDYTGELAITEGTLNLTTSLAGSLSATNDSILNISAASLAGDLTLSQGARLMLQTPSVTPAGAAMDSPVASHNNFQVKGNARFTNGGIYSPTITENSADLLSISGSAYLDGGQLQVRAKEGVYSKTATRYRILNAEQGINGQFAQHSISNPLLSMTPEYQKNDLYLSIRRNDQSISGLGITPNQKSTGTAFDQFTAENPLNAALVLLPSVDAIDNALDQTSGEIYASLKSSMTKETRFVRDAANDRLRSAFDSVAVNGFNTQDEAVTPDSAFWMQAWGSWGKLEGKATTGATLDHDVAGLIIGSDTQLGEWRVGGLAGYAHTSADVELRASSSTGDTFHVGAYAGRQFGSLSLRSGVMYGHYDNTVERTVNFEGYIDQLYSDVSAHAVHGFAELALPQQFDGFGIEPYANVSYVYLNTGSFAEKGKQAALSGGRQSSNNSFSTLGGRFEYRLSEVVLPATLSAQLGWQHTYGKVTPQSVHRFNGSTDFMITGVSQIKNAAIIGAAAELELHPDMKLSVSYQGMLGNSGHDNSVTGIFNWSF
ncbi:autotransporter-associated beta strand repeat-containing protein [Serratia microhaemolytica]|uniref:autotransporter-associated beta strand repeat-containing protein n=1 Tax=Serratia microhaemolytica TaxID=2675110 RepID=UPI000FDD0C8E|nr:autotransporter-associated beta strand repeat-containing protein [Serratia microhaemolytica]